MYQIVLYLFIFIIFGGLIGFKLSNHITNQTLYFLFWVMYVITFLTVISILGSFYIYDVIDDKTGPDGLKGEKGSMGELGSSGVCDPNCRDDMCYKELLEFCNQYLNSKYPSDRKNIEISNKYWKDRLTKICKSKELSNLITVRGRIDVLEYVKKILKVWLDLLYKEGGRLFFESMGAENEFEWRSNNPWNEIKKYDMYYWGMSEIFRIKKIKKCNKIKSVAPNKPRISLLENNNYNFSWNQKTHKGKRQVPHSFWKPLKLESNDETYYPVGDVYFNKREGDIKRGTKKTRGFIEINDTHYGPDIPTKVVSGDVKPPIDIKHIGSTYYYFCGGLWCRSLFWKQRRKRMHLHYWKLIPPKGYVAIGNVVASSRSKHPHVSKPDINDYRCIPEDCVEKIESPNIKMYNTGHTNIYQTGGDKSLNGHIFQAVNNNAEQPIYSYKIKEKCTIADDIPVDENQKYSNKWYEQPTKESKYSVMHYLSLPTKAILINKGNPKIFIIVEHIDNKPYNLYHIIQYGSINMSNDEQRSLLEALTPQNLKWKRLAIPKGDGYEWVINMDNKNYGEYLIQSKAYNQYLRISSNSDMSLVHHNKVDDYAYWKIKG